MMKNLDLICNLNSSAVAPGKGLRQEDQSVNPQTILLLHGGSWLKHFTLLRDSFLERNMDWWKSKWRTVERTETTNLISLLWKLDNSGHVGLGVNAAWSPKLQVPTQPGSFDRILFPRWPEVLLTSLLLYKPALLSSHSSSIHPALCPPSEQMTSNQLQTLATEMLS